MLKSTLLALTITSALLTACGGGGTPTPPTVTVPPIVTPPPVTAPPVTTPPVNAANPPFVFDQHEVTVKAGTSVTLTSNIKVDSLSDFAPGTGLNVVRPLLPAGGRDPIHVQVTAAANAQTYDIYVIGSGLKNPSNFRDGYTFDWVKVHVVGSAPAPWIHLEALTATTDPVETEFLKAINATRATGGTCTNPATGVAESWPAVPPVTLNVQASGGLRMKAEDAVLRNWTGVHVSPEGMGFTDFINMAGMTGFINEILGAGVLSSPDPVNVATRLRDGFLNSYYHCQIIFASSVDAGGQVAIGFYRSPSTNQAELLASFTDKPSLTMSPLLKLN